MSTDLMIPAPSTQHFVALSASELPQAQANVVQWCQAKIHALGAELREQRKNYRECKARKWRSSSWANVITRTKRQMVYYTKIKAALRAGYLIIPNFEIDVIACRVKGEAPRDASTNETRIPTTPDVLPPGQGRYVDDALDGRWIQEDGTDRQGKPIQVWKLTNDRYKEDLDFPGALVRPTIMDATSRAMARRIFDQVGIVTGRGKDPIVVGRVLSPKERWVRWNRSPRCVTFFIAWWLDPRDL